MSITANTASTAKAANTTNAASIREGSSLYYSLLWTEPAARQRFVKRLDLIQALATTLEDVQEPQVAEKKIHWWHEELQRLFDHQARHPATQACQAELQALNGAQAMCLDILSVASTQRFTPPATIEASDQALEQSYKARLALLSHALSSNEATLDSTAHTTEAALAFGYVDQLTRLPALVHRGLPVFSDEQYQQFQIQPHDLAARIRIAAAEDTPEIGSIKGIPVNTERGAQESQAANLPSSQALIDALIDKSKIALDTAINHEQTRAQYRTEPLLPIWRMLVLRQQQLKLWQNKRPDLLRERLTLTPLVKLYHCWRNKR